MEEAAAVVVVEAEAVMAWVEVEVEEVAEVGQKTNLQRMAGYQKWGRWQPRQSRPEPGNCRFDDGLIYRRLLRRARLPPCIVDARIGGRTMEAPQCLQKALPSSMGPPQFQQFINPSYTGHVANLLLHATDLGGPPKTDPYKPPEADKRPQQ